MSANYDEDEGNETLFSFPPPTPEESWRSFSYETRLEHITNTLEHYPLGGADTLSFSGISPGTTEVELGIVEVPSGAGTLTSPVYQRTGDSKFILHWTGAAVRHGYQIPYPRIISFGGVPAQIIGTSSFTTRSMGMVDNAELWAAKWADRYSLPRKPEGNLLVTDPDLSEFPLE